MKSPKYLIIGLLGLAIAVPTVAYLFPIALVVVLPAALICLLRAFTTKTCQACRKDMPARATVCPSCQQALSLAT